MTTSVNEAAALRALGRSRVLFLHQSRGQDVVAGVARRHGADLVAAVDVDRGGRLALSPGRISHGTLGRSGDPLAKLAALERRFDDGFDGAGATGPDVVAAKFSCDDFAADTDVDAVLARYLAAIAHVRAASPMTRVVHVTTPLTRGSDGVADLVKRLTGIGEQETAANIARARYNEKLRAAVLEGGGDDVVFDLERIESTRFDGTRQLFERDGRGWPSLVDAWTDDGVHLNPLGQDRAASAFLAALGQAMAPTRKSTPPLFVTPSQEGAAIAAP